MARLEAKLRDRAQGLSGEEKGTTEPAVMPRASRDVLTELPLGQIRPDPQQPRKEKGDLNDLVASIRTLGLVQPIIVRAVGYEAYEIIAGERRFTAAQELALPKIPAIVRTIEDHQKLEIQIVENLHRKDLSPLEEAASYQRLMEEFRLTQEALGNLLGRSQASINETLKLLELPETIRSDYRTSDKMNKSLLLEIAKQPTLEDQLGLWEEAKGGGLTVKKLREKKAKSCENSPGKMGKAPVQMTFRYPIQTEEATVTVVFERPQADPEEIIAALEQALEGEKAQRVE